MGLIDIYEQNAIKLPLIIAKHLVHLTLEEQILKVALGKAHSHVAWKWDANLSDENYRHTMSLIHEHLPRYDGKFKDYFDNSLRNIEHWIYDIAGYH